MTNAPKTTLYMQKKQRVSNKDRIICCEGFRDMMIGLSYPTEVSIENRNIKLLTTEN